MKITFTARLSMASTKTVRFWFTKFTKGKTHKSILLRETFSLSEGFIQERFSNFSSNRLFKQTNCQKTLSVKKNLMYSEHKFRPNKSCKLGQIWHRQRRSCDCRSALFANCRPNGLALGPILHVVHNSKRTHFNLIVDFELERF